MNLSAYRSTAREIPAVRTKVIPIDSEDSGGCSAADAISHADDAKSKISDKAAEILAKIGAKKFFKRMKPPQRKKLVAKAKNPAENVLKRVLKARNGKKQVFGGSFDKIQYIEFLQIGKWRRGAIHYKTSPKYDLYELKNPIYRIIFQNMGFLRLKNFFGGY